MATELILTQWQDGNGVRWWQVDRRRLFPGGTVEIVSLADRRFGSFDAAVDAGKQWAKSLDREIIGRETIKLD